MTRILVIGGYGGFGGRLSRRLAKLGYDVLVAGRDAERCAAFCGHLTNATPVTLDRNAPDLVSVLRAHRPDIVVDAAGPFQGSDHLVPNACIQIGVSYIDLADGRDFVRTIASLDQAARHAGVAIISGASSTPALSCAVARALGNGLSDVWTMDVAISASNRAVAGASVSVAILGYVGRAIRLWRGKRWLTAWGWQSLERRDFTVRHRPPLTHRWAALVDAPDHDLAPPLLPGCPSVIFRAGTEMPVQTIILWLLSWPIRWSSWRGLPAFARWLRPVQRMTAEWGSDRSAMSVRLTGARDGRPVRRTWTLIAEQGDGPEIPTLAATLLVNDLVAGRLAAGAYDSSQLLTLDRFETLFQTLALFHETTERPLPPPLYQRIMSEHFAALPPSLRKMHDVHGDAGAAGHALVENGGTFAARLIGRLMRFPPAGLHPLHVAFEERNGIERWTRYFGAHRFHSHLYARRGVLVERFGPLRFLFDLQIVQEKLTMRLLGWGCAGVKLPLWLAPRIIGEEWEEEGVFRFNVRVSHAMLGYLIGYAGWLMPVTAMPESLAE